MRITPAKYKSEFEFLKEVDSLALANEQLNLERAYKNFFRDKSIDFPKFKRKYKDKKSYTTNCVNDNIRIEKITEASERAKGKHSERIILPKLGKIRTKQHRAIPDNYKLKSCTVIQTPTGKYFAEILFEYEENIQPSGIKNIVGLDFSIQELYISNDEEYANYPKYFRRSLDKLKKTQIKTI